ncbi:MAG: peptidase T [Clostridia bacterium]|nr:peptidase T [Clostridia bacterium]
MKAFERLLRYVVVYTTSDEESTTVPTSMRQFDLAHLLVDELRALGISDAEVDDKCYVYATLPATEGHENATKLGFIAHMDTAPDFSGEHVCPRIIEHYDGNDVVLGTSGRTLDNANFPHLASLKGRTLIVTDGTTLLGADDKAGVAEIITMLEQVIEENIPHGKISVCFTPDEEVGSGADHFDVARFGADFAYTCDGGAEGELEYENFNAAGALFEIRGFNIHPGEAKDKMINALAVACEINAMLPKGQTPRDTAGYQGFWHLTGLDGTTEACKLSYIIRDHDFESFERRKVTLEKIAEVLNDKYGAGTVTLTIRDQYRNMKEKIEPCMHLIDNAKKAMELAGVTPRVQPIRGGTDGARLSYMGLPCPNLGTGGYAFHGPYEHITVEGMDASVEVLKNLVILYRDR